MATEETVNIIDLDIDEKDVIKKLTKLQEEITKLKVNTKDLTTENKKLEAEGKKNTKQYKDNSKQIEINKVQTKGLSTQYRNNQNTLVALTGTENKQLGTLQKLELSNKKLREESKTLDLTRKKGQTRLTQINKQLDQNNKTILKNADATKAQKMNIGNYGSALSGLPGPLAGAARGSQTLLTAFKALIANPIGLIIAAIALAIKLVGDAVKRNQGMLDRFQQLGAGISAAYGAVLDRINGIIGVIKKLGRLDWETIKNGFKELGKEMKEDFETAVNLKTALQELYRMETADITQKAELRKKIEEARLESKRANITEQERLVFLQDAMKFENELLDIQLAAAVEKERIAKEEGKINKNIDVEDREIALAKENRINVEIASLKRKRTLASELKTVEVKAAKEKLDLAEQEALAAVKAVDNLIQLERIKSVAINDIKDEDVEKQKERLDNITELNEAAAEHELTLADLVAEEKLSLAQGFAGNIATIFGKNTAIGKAAAIAETAINTYRGAQAAYASLAGIPVVGPVLGAAAAGAAIVSGLANVKKILSVKSGLPGDSAMGVSGIGGSIATPRGTFATSSRAALTDGGLTTQGLVDGTAKAVKEGVRQALIETPMQQVLVIDEVTAKQGQAGSINKVATV